MSPKQSAPDVLVSVVGVSDQTEAETDSRAWTTALKAGLVGRDGAQSLES